VKQNAPSFSTANVLRGWVEQLPDVPRWHHQTFTIPGYSTKSPITLYWRDGLEVIKHLFSNPVFANCMEFDAYRLVERCIAVDNFLPLEFPVQTNTDRSF
jgi:Plavaka transposase